MKSCKVELSDELYKIYRDIAELKGKRVEDCLSIILERVIRTMVEKAEPPGNE